MGSIAIPSGGGTLKKITIPLRTQSNNYGHGTSHQTSAIIKNMDVSKFKTCNIIVSGYSVFYSVDGGASTLIISDKTIDLANVNTINIELTIGGTANLAAYCTVELYF